VARTWLLRKGVLVTCGRSAYESRTSLCRMITDPLFYAVAVPAVILVGLSKGGFRGIGLLSLPLMALVISPVRAAAIMLPILIVQDSVALWAYRHIWDRRNLQILFPSAAVGVVLGYLLAEYVSDAGVGLAVGIFSVIFAVRQLIKERAGPVKTEQPGGVAAGWFWGVLTGFTSMIGNAGGPTFQIYVMPQRLPRDIFVGTGCVFFAILNWIKVPPFIALGQFTPDNLLTAIALFPVAIVSTWAGVLLVRRVSGERFYTLIYAFLIPVGLKLIWDGITGL
jgi:uncharacterized protein